FHVSNEEIKKEYLPSRAVNLDIYLMYVAIIVLFGEFYDSYQSTEATRNFLPMKEWLSSLNNHISSIKEIDKDELKKIEKDSEYNWVGIVEKWEAMDDLRENVKVQDARTVSRLSFLNTVKRFLENQGLITDIGNDEIELTEKAKTIVQKYYMEYEFNRGILDFMYQAEREGKERKNAVHIENKVH
ncbi:MAG TPA: non-ribosomal peptide synthetase module, partial [Clostridium sp.]|nr:non-ribosomal peptide synthetase module [Clostridium sp.]